MFGYLRFLPDYFRAVVRRWQTASGLVIGIVLVLALAFCNVGSPRIAWMVTLLLMAVLLVEANYGVYRTAPQRRSEFEKSVRISAKVNRWAQNLP